MPVAVGGENEQFHVGVLLAQEADGGHPGKARHVDIDQGDIRWVFFDHFHGFEAVIGLADKVDVGMLAETHAQSGAQQGMIIGQKDFERFVMLHGAPFGYGWFSVRAGCSRP